MREPLVRIRYCGPLPMNSARLPMS
jgi:hypothetical protein